MQHPATPRWLKIIGVLIVAYALSPIDLVPDFLPIIGYLDELLLLPALMWIVMRCTPPAILIECRQRADEWLASGNTKPSSKLGAIVVVLVWLTLAWWLIALFSSALA